MKTTILVVALFVLALLTAFIIDATRTETKNGKPHAIVKEIMMVPNGCYFYTTEGYINYTELEKHMELCSLYMAE